MRGYNCNEEIKVYRTASRFRAQPDGNRHSGRRSIPQNGHFGSHVFQLETKVFRSQNLVVAAVQATQKNEFYI